MVKFLSQVSTDEVERLQAQMQQSRDANKQHASGRAVEIHERLVALSKEDFSFRYRVIRKLFREIQKLEEMSLLKSENRYSKSTGRFPGVLFNPLLQIPSVWG